MRITVSLLGALLLVAACGGEPDDGGPSPAFPTPTTGPPIAINADRVWSILVDHRHGELNFVSASGPHPHPVAWRLDVTDLNGHMKRSFELGRLEAASAFLLLPGSYKLVIADLTSISWPQSGRIWLIDTKTGEARRLPFVAFGIAVDTVRDRLFVGEGEQISIVDPATAAVLKTVHDWRNLASSDRVGGGLNVDADGTLQFSQGARWVVAEPPDYEPITESPGPDRGPVTYVFGIDTERKHRYLMRRTGQFHEEEPVRVHQIGSSQPEARLWSRSTYMDLLDFFPESAYLIVLDQWEYATIYSADTLEEVAEYSLATSYFLGRDTDDSLLVSKERRGVTWLQALDPITLEIRREASLGVHFNENSTTEVDRQSRSIFFYWSDDVAGQRAHFLRFDLRSFKVANP